ncbi:MAG: DegT/DnrJ/EryC1/StrS family aminotransferase [Armatimonadota bacterium]
MSDERLAIEGGTPVRTEPLPGRSPFGLDDVAEVVDALRNGTLFYPSGKKVYEFERAFADLYGVEHVVTSTSGTAAIHVALGAVNPEPGDEVITTPISDMGTVAPIILCNCIPVFADLQPGTFNLDPDDVERKVTDRTRAIIVVHCWGQPADMDRIMAIAERHDLYVIEDCAQAHYTRYRGRLVGTIGHLGAMSLQDSKHLQCGDGGVTITNDDDLGKRAALFMDKGCDWSEDRKYRLRYAFIGPCYRMTELQGAVLVAQLRRLPWIVERRQRLGDRLAEMLQGVPNVHPPERIEGAEHSYWQFPLRVDEEAMAVEPGTFGEALSAEGVPNGKWIGKPLYMFEAIKDKIAFGTSQYPWAFTERGRAMEYHEGMCPNAEMAQRQLYSVPLNERMNEHDVSDIATAVRKVAEHYSST